jgi:hypothetical protein
MLFSPKVQSSLSSEIIAYLQEQKMKFEVTQNGQVIKMGVAGENANWRVIIVVEEDRHQFQMRCISPVNAPIAKQARVAELLTRLNYAMNLGSLIMDYSDGEIALKVTHICHTTKYLKPTFHQLFHVSQNTFDHCLSAIMSVIYGGQEPALAALEADF